MWKIFSVSTVIRGGGGYLGTNLIFGLLKILVLFEVGNSFGKMDGDILCYDYNQSLV